MDKPTLSIIIPAYNEVSRIGGTLRSIEQYFTDANFSYEIIVVDDGSTDGTVELVRTFTERLPELKILENGANRGKGYSVKKGMFQAKGEYRLFMDADNSVDISHLNVFMRHLQKGYAVVIGSIKIPNASVAENAGWYRRVLGDLSKIVVRIFTIPDIYDTQRGFKLFRAEAAEMIFPLQTIDRFGFDIEVLTIAHINGLKVKELPVVWKNPPGSTVTLITYFQTLRELIYIMRNRLAGKYAYTANNATAPTSLHHSMVLPTFLAFFGIMVAVWVRFLNLGYNTAFNDEAIYIVIGKLGLFQWDWWSYNAKSWMAGLPYIYPLLAAIASQSYGIISARLLSVFVSLLILEEIYRLARILYIFDKKQAHLGGVLAAFFSGFAAVGLFVSRLATYDALAILFLLFSINLLARADARKDGRDYFLSAVAIFFAIATKIIIAAYLPLLFVLSLAHIRPPKIRILWLRYFLSPLIVLLFGLTWINADGFAAYAQSQIGREYIDIPTILAAFWYHAKFAILLGIPAVLAALRWGRRNKTIWLAAAASMIPMIHILTHRLSTLDKHLFFFIIFMSIIIGHSISILLHRKNFQLVGAVLLVVFSFIYIQAESRRLYALEHSWTNADAMLAVLVEKTQPGNKVLSEEGAATILALYDKIPPENVSTFDWLQYQNMTGERAYLQAVRDGYFDLIELNGQTESHGDLSEKIRAELSEKYSRIHYNTPFEIYVRSL